MMDRGLVVVGSGPAGLAAVRAFRKQDADTAVTMITADPYPPYARPPLTKDFAQGATDLDDLWLTEPGWFDAQRVELRLGTTVTGLDTARQQLARGSHVADLRRRRVGHRLHPRRYRCSEVLIPI